MYLLWTCLFIPVADIDKRHTASSPSFAVADIDPLPARALYADLSTRFSSLKRPTTTDSAILPAPLGLGRKEDENVLTVDDLLAELGPEQDWSLKTDDEQEIGKLLHEAQTSLKDVVQSTDSKNDEGPTGRTEALPQTGLDVFQQEPDSDEDDTVTTIQSESEMRKSVDDEADEYLQRILDEIEHEPPDLNDAEEEARAGQHETLYTAPPPYSPREPDYSEITKAPKTVHIQSSIFDLPSTPSKDPRPASDAAPHSSTSEIDAANTDDDLASRFASLSTSSLALPSAPTGKPTAATTSTRPVANTYTDSDIETWCTICNDDATLRCLGCEGELYCTSCWNEGHRGEDAGYEERTHKAVLYGKDKTVKPKQKRRVGVGAG